jgi:hypothetical protein
MSTANTALMTAARQEFEKHLLTKNLEFKWDGKRYTRTNLQTKWRYFLLGYFAGRSKA